jgi:hypothetical protein
MIIKMVLLSFIVLSSVIAISWIVAGGEPQTSSAGTTDDSKTDDSTTDDSKTDDSKTDDSKTDDSTTDDSTTDGHIVADAGKDQHVTEDERIKLDGSDSHAPDGGSIISWTWSVIDSTGPSPLLINPNTAHPTFSAIGISSDSKYTIKLDVSDNLGKTDSDTVDIYAIPKAETSIEGGSTEGGTTGGDNTGSIGDGSSDGGTDTSDGDTDTSDGDTDTSDGDTSDGDTSDGDTDTSDGDTSDGDTSDVQDNLTSNLINTTVIMIPLRGNITYITGLDIKDPEIASITETLNRRYVSTGANDNQTIAENLNNASNATMVFKSLDGDLSFVTGLKVNDDQVNSLKDEIIRNYTSSNENIILGNNTKNEP